MKKTFFSLVLGLFLLGNLSFAQGNLEAAEDRYEDQIDAMNLPEAQEDRLEDQMEAALLNGENFSLENELARATSGVINLNTYTNCEVNGVEVSCDQFLGEVENVVKQIPFVGNFLNSPDQFLKTIIWIVVISSIIAILSFIFWLRMLIDLINHQKENAAIRAVVLIVLNFLGALIYYFTARRTRLQQEKMQAAATQA